MNKIIGFTLNELQNKKSEFSVDKLIDLLKDDGSSRALFYINLIQIMKQKKMSDNQIRSFLEGKHEV